MVYCDLIQNLIQLTYLFPNATGSEDLVENAFGKVIGKFIGFSLLIEFLFATPAVANSIGEYISFIYNVPENAVIYACVIVAVFSVLVTSEPVALGNKYVN